MITPMTQGFARDLSVVMNKNVLMKMDINIQLTSNSATPIELRYRYKIRLPFGIDKL